MVKKTIKRAGDAKVSRRHTKNSQIKVSELIAAREAHHKKSTRDVNHALLQHLLAFCRHEPCICDITESFCFKFANYLIGRVTLSSARTYLHKLLALLEYAATHNLIARHTMPSIKELLPRFTTTPRTYLTLDELTALENTPCRHSETKRAFLFACQTGLRLSDIETLCWDNIIDINGTLTIVKSQVKTGHEVRIPLNSIATQLLGNMKTNGVVFNLLSRSVISSDLREWASNSGLSKRLTFHVSRHTFATQSISAGVDIYVVSKLCGHTTVKTTEIYAHLIDKTLQNGVDMLSKAMMKDSDSLVKIIKSKMHCIVKTVFGKVFRRKKRFYAIVNNT